MSETKNEFTPDLPWTIERQLKAYANAEGHTDRHEILYHTWRQNSRWFSRILEYTIDSYPKYSQHNALHCQAVIHNIECLLGEYEIKRLSPTDCYAILTAVYMHDIGMCITRQRKLDIVNSGAFVDWIDHEFCSFNANLVNHITNLRRKEYDFENDKNPVVRQSNYKKLYGQKLDTAESTEQLISEYQRKNHAETSSNWMKEEILTPSEINYGLSITGIPKRIHLTIADCALLHGVANIEELMQLLMALRQEDNGFVTDFYHPRFIAVLLMLGDALDIDNDRFHPYARTMAGGDLGEPSETHYRKHQAIRALQITPKMIFIRADCEKPAEMRMLRNDINWLQKFITECSYQWSKIAPNNYCGYLPRVDFEQISLGGKHIAERLVKAQFHLSQQKAFKLLEGASLYDNHFVYLREMLQNAIDAIKIQYWNDLDATEFDTNPNVSLCDANIELPLRKYPVKIDFAIRKRRKGQIEDLQTITLDDIMTVDEFVKYDVGVQVSIQDCGIGIGEEDIVAISKVGTSQDHRRSFIQSMPAWLLPTGRFGIGLQSLFQADRIFKCVTRTHRDECFEMTFHSGTNNEGYINVIPKEWRDGENGSVPYGTKFTLFVPQNRKQTHTVNMSGWAGMDPYAEDYAAGRPLRRAVELMKQMEAQIDSWVGECLFPVVIREERLDISLCQAGWEKRLTPHTEPKMIKINFQQVDPRTHKTEKHSESNRQLCWLFTRHNKKPFLWGDLEDKSASYYIDDEHCTLHIWSQEASCFFACNSNRIVRAITKDPVLGGNKQEEQGKKIKIFLKGLLINELIYEDDELIEYIDIKNDQLQEYLYMSRNAFSTQGEQIIKNDIIPLLRKAFHNVLKHINQTAITVIGNNRSDITDKIVDHYLQINSEEINDFSETDPVYIRKRDLLEKKLNACDLFDFTVVGRDIRRALPNSDEERRLNEFFWRPIQKDPQEDLQEDFLENVQEDLQKDLHSCYRIHKCIPQELFQDFPNSDAVRKRMETTIRSKIDKLCEQNQDIFSHQLDIFLEKMGSLYRCFFDETYQPSRVDIIDDAKWIRNFTILHAMLFFYTQQGSFPSKSGCISSGQEPCGWAYVNRRIAYALMDLREADKYLVSNHKEFIKEVEELLFVPAIAEKGRSTLSESRCSLAELMLPENQFAVFSTRQSRFDPWKHMLIRLHPLSNHSLFLAELDRALGGPDIYHVVSRFESDPNILDVLKYCPKDKSECAARWAFLDYWFYFYISKIMKEWFIQVTSLPTGEGFGDGSRVTEDIWGNLITKWIVRKLPSVALGADPSGNNRMNVLSPRTEPYIFYDARMLQLLVKRIEERYRHFHANRFVTSVWDGLDALACEGVSTNILSVNRGTIPAETKKTQMLLAFGSVLPQPLSLDMIPASMAAQNTISQPESESRKIQTFFELLNAVQECYRGNGVVPDFKLRQLHKLMKEFHSIQELQPFHNKYRDSDHKLVKLLQDYYTDHSDSLKRTIDRKLMARNQRVLEETIEMNYTPNDISARIVPRYFTYAETNIPIDRQTFMCAFFLTLYKFDLATLPDELRTDITKLLYGDDTSKVLNLQPYANKDELYDTYINIRAAQEYCNHWAKTDFRNAFLECICDWYWENVWKKGRASSFLAFTRDHQSVSRTDQELESLYRTQLRRIFCAAIDGIETEYLK